MSFFLLLSSFVEVYFYCYLIIDDATVNYKI